ncbi:MAG: ABC transporter ATP-binding protein [Candidatus Marinimicrobia bacterium]|nr:ABC transporter ATP-binding protein [Candidatus Neomarinimicrobiota bacterium]
MEASISLKKVGKILNSHAVLAGLSFGIERGTILSVVGPNGAGKSTLLKVIAGILKPEYGSVFIHGKDNQLRKKETKRLIGYMPQNFNLDPHLSVRENLYFSASLFGLKMEIVRSQVRKYAKTFHIRELLDHLPDELSYGHLKRILFVRSLLHDPPILLLDEPTTSLDIPSRHIVWDYLHSVRGEKTVVYTTQSIEEAEKVHDRIAILHQGKVVLDGSLDKLLENIGELHHFQIHFEHLTEDVFTQLCKISTIVNPKKIGEIFDFYGRNRRVLFDVMKVAIQSNLVDYRSEKVSLETLIMTSTERFEN